MASRKSIVETELAVKVPKQYEAFLNKYGIYEAAPLEVYGITESLLSYDGIPCVIGATRIYRKYGVPHRFLVLHHTGIEDEIVCLDTVNEKVYSVSRLLGTRIIADSFNEWFARDILQFSEEIEKYREDSDEQENQKERG